MEFSLPAESSDFAERFGMTVAEPLHMTWRLRNSAHRKRVAVLVSRYDHCLLELLWRWRRDELDADLVLVASNWNDLRDDVETFGLPYQHVPVRREGKAAAEAPSSTSSWATVTSWSSRATCRACPASSSSGSAWR